MFCYEPAKTDTGRNSSYKLGIFMVDISVFPNTCTYILHQVLIWGDVKRYAGAKLIAPVYGRISAVHTAPHCSPHSYRHPRSHVHMSSHVISRARCYFYVHSIEIVWFGIIVLLGRPEMARVLVVTIILIFWLPYTLGKRTRR